MDVPWIIGGDFNTFLSLDEHRGRSTTSLRSLQDFNYFVSSCSLQSINFQGSPYTWSDGRCLGRVFRRLDRYLCSSDFFDLFGPVQYQHLNRITSNHSPIFIDCSAASLPESAAFRYLDVWSTHPKFNNYVTQHWQSFPTVGGMRRFYFKLQQLKRCLVRWNKDVFGNFFDVVIHSEEEVTRCERVYDSSPSDASSTEYHLSMANLRMAQSHAVLS